MLGYSEKILSNWGDTSDHPLNILRALRKATRRKMGSISGIGVIDGDTEKHYIPNFHCVSDSVVISLALPSPIVGRDLWNEFISIALTVTVIQECSWSNGYIVRGGIELGQISWAPKEILGPSLLRAMNLEKNANISRIVAGSILMRGLWETRSCMVNTMWPAYLNNLLYISSDSLICLRPRTIANRPKTTNFSEIVKGIYFICTKKYGPDGYRLKKVW